MGEIANKNLILAAMIFAVAMTFIDQTIVSIAVPDIQRDLHLSSTGVQWVINGYLLSLSALFALGGKLADMLGHRRMVVLGVVVFAAASTLCGLTPDGGISEGWMIVFRLVQGAGAAIMFPAALAIVISSFPLRERGQAMAKFFGITGGLTAVGPLAGGYLTEWTWRAIFWVNIPVAIISLLLIARSKPDDVRRPGPVDFRGAVLIAAGMGLAVLGLQQSSIWGWGSVATWGCLIAGLALIAGFAAFELRQENPLIQIRIFADRAFAVDNVMLFLLSMTFVPYFFFASVYSQVSLGYDASTAGLYLLVFFGGFAWASQIGGRMLDARGARHPIVLGAALAAVGFYLTAHQLTVLSLNSQWVYIAMAGGGIGMMLAPASTDAVNRAPSSSYGEATGITQTVRNFGASLGMAILGTVLITQNRLNIESGLGSLGVPKAKADEIAASITSSGGGGGMPSGAGPHLQKFVDAVQHGFAASTQTVFYVMAGIMALAFVIAFVAQPAGKMEAASGPAGPEPPAPDPVA